MQLRFDGVQECDIKDMKSFRLFTLIDFALGNRHPVGSTVSENTLRKHGVIVPEHIKIRDVVTIHVSKHSPPLDY